MKHKLIAFVTVTLLTLGLIQAPVSAAPAPANKILEAQRILRQFEIPTGPVDGRFGAQTARGLCAYRVMTGQAESRAGITTSLLTHLRNSSANYPNLSKLPTSKLNGRPTQSTYLLINKKCQVMIYVENGHFVKVMPVSTGRAGYETPNGSYRLGYTARGWYCSKSYPEGCNAFTNGHFADGTKGNMYNRRNIVGGYFVHGSNNVPTYPGSHGCVRITVSDADWMYYHVGNGSKPYMIITGKW